MPNNVAERLDSTKAPRISPGASLRGISIEKPHPPASEEPTGKEKKAAVKSPAVVEA